MTLRNWFTFMALALSVFFAKVRGDVIIVFDERGYSPSEIGLYESAEDEVTANAYSTTICQEIPNSECTYSWTIAEVWNDQGYMYDATWTDQTAYNGYTHSRYLSNANSQTCLLGVEVYAEGYWYFILEVEVTYPDGYCKVFRKETQIGGIPVCLAGI